MGKEPSYTPEIYVGGERCEKDLGIKTYYPCKLMYENEVHMKNVSNAIMDQRLNSAREILDSAPNEEIRRMAYSKFNEYLSNNCAAE